MPRFIHHCCPLLAKMTIEWVGVMVSLEVRSTSLDERPIMKVVGWYSEFVQGKPVSERPQYSLTPSILQRGR